MKHEPTLRAAVRKTIALLKRRPECYRFSSISIPQTEEGHACLLGWIGFYTEAIKGSFNCISSVENYYGLRDWDFYTAMDRIARTSAWMYYADSAAACLKALLVEGFFGHPDKRKRGGKP